MIKLFYTDPLIAAYMSREFGVRFANNNTDGAIKLDDLFVTFSSLDNHTSGQVSVMGLSVDLEVEEEIYIHPEDYNIFEPQQNDVMRTIIPDSTSVENIGSDIRAKEFIHLMKTRGAKIIMRNNKHFFMPEREED